MPSATHSDRHVTPSPLWASAFRPFYLLGSLYAPLLAIAWLGAYLGHWQLPGALPLKLLHAHEFIFGFAAAIILGIVITALPSWARTEEIEGGRLTLLVALWLLGRIAFWTSSVLPAPLPAILDCLLYAAAIAMLAPQLAAAKNRFYLLLLPILAGLFVANLCYYHGAARGDADLAGQSLRGAIYTIVVLYVLKGGVLAPIFTGTALRETGRGEPPAFLMRLELAGFVALLTLAAWDLGGAPRLWTGGAALACTLLYGLRSARWQGWRVADVPLLLPMHLGFAWLLLAFALKAVADLTGALPEAAWLHAFTVGSLGMMMLGLMTRVSQRHTGRPLEMPPAMMVACGAMFLAAVLRVAAGVGAGGDPQVVQSQAIALATLLWAGAFVIYLGCYARVLVSPSLPRRVTSADF
ncbi:MAG: NnrS family protein [Rhodocyclales bacterium]|nr:NnrS family protein [Rhodocyclales bacterium]